MWYSDMDDFVLLLTDNDEELLMFDLILNTKDRNEHYLRRIPGIFDLDKLTDSYCFLHFRFYKAHIRRLIVCFNIPYVIRLKSGAKVRGEEAMCILLRRLAYPNRFTIIHSK